MYQIKITACLTKVDALKNINFKATIVSLDKMIYHAIYEIRHRVSKRPDEKRIFSFVKEFLDGNC